MQCSAWRLNLECIDCGVVIWRGRASGSGQTLSAPQLLTLLTFCLQRQYRHVHRWVSIMSVALQRYKQNQPVSTHYIHECFHANSFPKLVCSPNAAQIFVNAGLIIWIVCRVALCACWLNWHKSAIQMQTHFLQPKYKKFSPLSLNFQPIII